MEPPPDGDAAGGALIAKGGAMSLDDRTLRRWEELGPDVVRTMLNTGGIVQALNVGTIEWLAEKDREALAKGTAEQQEQLDVAKSSRDAAWASAGAAKRSADAAEGANRRATIALVVAGLSMMVAVCAIYVAHRDIGRSDSSGSSATSKPGPG